MSDKINNSNDKIIRCSFCGGTNQDIGPLINGPDDVFICSRCIATCCEIFDKMGKDGVDIPELSHIRDIFYNSESVEEYDDEDNDSVNLLPPVKIKERLDQYIIGQDNAKKVLAVAVYNHYKRVNYLTSNLKEANLKNSDDLVEEVELEKTNVLLFGATGTGKTLLARTLARIIDVPFAIADATTLTQAGYVGEDVENILLKLIKAADYDIKRAERGIVYIDEIDKIAKKGENVSITRDVSGEGVQQALLKIIEGTVASVPPQGGRKHPQQECLEINTENILFICGGAFVGLDKIVKNRGFNANIGFGAAVENTASYDYTKLVNDVRPEDLIKFGLIPEFVGRIPLVVALEALDANALVRILKEPRNALIKQYKKLFSMENIEIIFDDDSLEEVAKKAIKLNTGARGLRSILEGIMLDIMYVAPSENNVATVRITKNCISGEEKPTLIYKTA